MLANFQRVVFLELGPQTPLPTMRAKPWSSGSGPGMAVGHGEMAKAGWGRLAGKRVKDVELDCYSILQLIHDYIVIVFHNHCFHMFRFMNHTSCIHTLSFFPYIASSLPKVASFNSCWFAALGVDLAKWSKAEPNQNPAKHAVGQTCGNSAHVSIVPIDLWNTYHSSMSAAASASFFFLKLFSSALSWTKSSMNSIYMIYACMNIDGSWSNICKFNIFMYACMYAC